MTLKLKGLPARLREPANRSHLIWVLVIFAVAVALRSLWVAYARADPTDGRAFADDALFYHWSAVSLAAGNGYTMFWIELSHRAVAPRLQPAPGECLQVVRVRRDEPAGSSISLWVRSPAWPCTGWAA